MITSTPPIALERHYSVLEVAKMWGVSRHIVTEHFKSEPGVMRIDRKETRDKRGYLTLRIPESVVLRVHEHLTKIKKAA